MMAETPSSEGLHNTASRPSSQGPDPLSLVWQFFADPRTLMILLGLLVLVLMLGSLLPQIPPEATNDPETWLAMQSGTWGQMSGLVHTLGLHDLLHSPGFSLLLAIVGLTLFVWLVDSATLAWRANGWHIRSRTSWPPASFRHWGKNALELRADSSLSLEGTESRTRECLIGQDFRVSRVASQSLPNLVAHKRAPALWAWPVFHGAVLAALVGLAIGVIWGWRTPGWQFGPGDSQAVAHGTPYSVRLDAFEFQQDDEGRLLDYRSHVTWLESGEEIGRSEAVAGRPMTLGGLVVRQTGYAPAVKVRGRDSSGRPLALQLGGDESDSSGELAVTFPVLATQQFIPIGVDEQFVVLSFEPMSAEGKPSLHVDLLGENGAERQPLAILHGTGIVEIGDLRLEMQMSYRPILRVEYRPGLGLVVGGAALAVLALAVAWLASPRLVWIALGAGREGGTRVHLMAPPSARGSRWPRRLASHLQEEFDDA